MDYHLDRRVGGERPGAAAGIGWRRIESKFGGMVGGFIIEEAGETLMASWPAKPKRDALQARAADRIKSMLRSRRNAFAGIYTDFIFDRITGGYRRSIRAEELVYQTAEIAPGLCPTRKEVDAESRLLLAEKKGVEIAWRIFSPAFSPAGMRGCTLFIPCSAPCPNPGTCWRNSGGTAN